MNKKRFLSLLFISTLAFAAEEIPPVIIFSRPSNNKTVDSFNTLSQVQTISTAQFTASGSQSLLDVMNSQTGIQIVEPNGVPGRAVFSMRGFGDNAASNTLILLDGQPYFNPDMGALMPNAFSLMAIKKIEVMPSSGGVLYGDQAVGGVINIITKEPEAKTAEIATNYGSFATRRAQFVIGDIGKNKFGYRVEASVYASNNYREHSAEHTNNFFVNCVYQDAYFRYRKINQHLEMPGKLTWLQVEQNPRQAENDIAYNNQDNDLFQLGLKYNIAENWLVKMDTSMRLMQGIGAYVFNQQSVTFNELRQVATVQPKISGIINLYKYSIFPIIGMDLNYGKYKINSSQAQQNQSAFYGQFTIPLMRKVTAVFGSRYGLAFYHLSSETIIKTNPINRTFITDLELSWQVLSSLRLFTKRSENYRFPKTDEIMFTIDGSPLKPQRGVSYEVGVNGFQNPLKYGAVF